MKTFIVDSFTDVPFRGNPAGVCLIGRDLPSGTMLLVAQELGLSETAFVRIDTDPVRIRYFSPVMEIPLCGHATLAAARVVCNEANTDTVRFLTSQGIELPVDRSSDQLTMHFPRYEVSSAEAPAALQTALGIDEIETAAYNEETRILMLVIESKQKLASLSPNFEQLRASHDSINGVLVTAASTDDAFDFHSRYFWPWSGTNEDPVTGGTHTFLAPYWAERLGKNRLKSFQSSARTGFMDVEVGDHGLKITGQAVVILSGQMHL
ncbi:MAG: PhzF family phenazine biosynthesis protein [Planctomycetaceae bacterium]